GYSGTGKSVTLQNMTGLLVPDRGTIYIDGQQIVGMAEDELEETRRKFGYLFQSGALINWLTVAENVELPLREHTSLSRKERKRVVADKLKLVNMEDDGDKYPSDISGGMKKRAALARAIALEPEIVLFDEPTSGLDPVISRQIDELIKAINRVMGITCIVVTHDMESAYGIADHIAFFYKGGVHFLGTPFAVQNTNDEAMRHFVSGGKEGRLTQKSMTAIIRSQPMSPDAEGASDTAASPISANVEERLRKTIKETRRLTPEEIKHRRKDKGHTSKIKAPSGSQRRSAIDPSELPTEDGVVAKEEKSAQAQGESRNGKSVSLSESAVELENPKPAPDAETSESDKESKEVAP
ncbi:MAG: ATP-binding cassette domain-containing protein, partial [Planctomycetes bacterium]|nr:ATP-binding cassette domain-containing protein [Planctomycetota bacterium]